MQPYVPVVYAPRRPYIATAGLGAASGGGGFWTWLPWLLLFGGVVWYAAAQPAAQERKWAERSRKYTEGFDDGMRACEAEHEDHEPGTLRSPRLLFGRDREELEGARTERAPAMSANRRRRNARRYGRRR